MKLDSIDTQLLNFLQKDAKQTNKELASKLDMSVTAVYERIKKLEKASDIAGGKIFIIFNQTAWQLIVSIPWNIKRQNRKRIGVYDFIWPHNWVPPPAFTCDIGIARERMIDHHNRRLM